MKKRYFILFVLIFSLFVKVIAQTNSVLSKAEAYNKTLPIEKLYISFDKNYYSAGDTVWFKTYLLNGDFTSSQRSGKIYVELFNDSLKMIENRVIALNNGLGYGDYALSKNLSEGTYTIRAYSNWQQNFGSDYFFQKSFFIGNAGDKTWLLNSFQEISTSIAAKTLDLKLRITNLKNEAIGLKDIEVNLMNGNKRMAKADLQTKLDGTLDTKIPLTNIKLNKDFNIQIVDQKNRTQKAILPISLQKQDEVDLQFMPEGGYLVNGIFGKVAFKAIGSDGLGKEISGKILNSKSETVAGFASTNKGMGSFYLLPTKGEIYTAIYQLNGREQKKLLPAAKEDGTSLRIDALSKQDTIYVYLKATETKRTNNYQLFAQATNQIIASATVNLSNGISVIKLAKNTFPSGVIHFTLLSPDAIPLNERQIFINNKQKINLSIKTNEQNYAIRDSIALDIIAAKEDGTPLSGSFAISVSDDGQVQQQKASNIGSYFLLESELQGNIEDAGWYFKDNDALTLLALDHLLLTQGWIGYNWKEILQPIATVTYKAEKNNEVNGMVTGLFNKPKEGIIVNMLSLGKHIMATDTLTDANGRFTFTDLPLIDSAAYNIKIKNVKGKTATGNIMVEEFKKSTIPVSLNLIKPWYVNTDTAMLSYFKSTQKQIQINERAQMMRTGTLLKEVEIKGQMRLKEIVTKDAWDAKFMDEITEADLKKIPQKSLKDLLNEKFPSFNIGNFWADGCASKPERHRFSSFRIGSSLISHVLIDKINTNLVANGINDGYQETGTSISAMYIPEQDILYGLYTFQTNNYIFDYLNASEVKNIKLYRGCCYYYLDITTRGGQGPWIAPTPGRYIYRPLPIHIAKEFYSPKYTANASSLPDYRSTIFWDANVVTDENGKAKVSFYAADKPTTYTVKIEGTDLFGRFGYHTSNIKIVNKTESK